MPGEVAHTPTLPRSDRSDTIVRGSWESGSTVGDEAKGLSDHHRWTGQVLGLIIRPICIYVCATYASGSEDLQTA